MRLSRLSVVVGAGLAVAGCVDTSGMPQAPAVPAPLRVEGLPPYMLQPGDVLDIRLMLNPELNEEVAVRPDGHIATTLAPDVVAAGRTIPQLTGMLRQAYSHDLSNPRVSVILKSIAPTRVYVAGEVVTPGEFALTTPGTSMSLAQALARAGGLKPSASAGSIFIIRRPGNVHPEFLAVRYDAVVRAHDPAADVLLAANDIVYVPKTGVAEVYGFYNQYIQQFFNPSFSFTYLLNPEGGGVVTTPQGTSVSPGVTPAPSTR